MIPYLLSELLTAGNLAWLSRSLTAVVGLFVAGMAYRGFRRNDSPKMLLLAIGIGLLTTGVFLAVVVVDGTGAGDGVVLLARGLVTVVGLCAVLYALAYE